MTTPTTPIGAGTTTFSADGTIDLGVIQVTGTYDIVAEGAQGGSDTLVDGTVVAAGGEGAKVGGDIYLTAGTTLDIVVGVEGGNATNYNNNTNGLGAGGGGGSFVFETSNGTITASSTLLVAGGGGGGAGGWSSGQGGSGVGLAASTSSQGLAGRGTGTASGAGGNGDNAGKTAAGSNGGGGGGYTGGAGGFGKNLGYNSSNGQMLGTTFAGGVAVPVSETGTDEVDGAGGFGGGGAGGNLGGGGGGGYGGGGGSRTSGGGGGGSYESSSLTETETITAKNEGNGLVTIALVACYCRGTLVLTEAGERAIEDLAIGERVVTASGAIRPVKWIARRAYSGRFLRANRHLWPITIRAGALAENVPSQDLRVSPTHAMFLDGLLIPAEALANGATILFEPPPERVEYFHIELDSHDVILAEGAPSESFIDDDSRALFHNAHEYAALYPDEERVPAMYCAPRVERGHAVAAVRAWLAERAGIRAVAAE